MLCIQVEVHDRWLWKAISAYRRRMEMIEYNAFVGAESGWARRYDPAAIRNRTSYYGARLRTPAALANKNGYRLLGAIASLSTHFLCGKA